MNFKKLFFVAVSIFSIFILSGCDFSTDNNESSKYTYSLNESAIYKNVEYTITNVEYSNGNEWDHPSSGKKYVIITLKIENKSDKKISYNALDYKMVNSQGQEDDESFTTINNDTSLSSGDLISGGVKTGTLVFEEAEDETSLKLLYYSNIFDDKAKFEIVVK